MEIPPYLNYIREFVDIDGKVEKIKYYRFADGIFSFWEAEVNKQQRVVFRVRIDTDVERRAFIKGLPSGRPIHPAKQEDIEKWLKSHPDYPILESL
ncbi:MAG: hypothetical protein NT116_06435 [Candidatus Parcubacteria bacterium]|nr:hypothetical protein [Candidatus Parcubacteria bacterium]